MQFGTPSDATAVHAKSASSHKRMSFLRTFATFSAILLNIARPVGLSMCMFLMTFVRWFSIPSPFAAALLLAREERSSLYTLLGLAASLLLRILWGLDADIWQYAGCFVVWLIKLRFHPKAGIETAALGGIAMMPRAIAALSAGQALPILLSSAAIPLAMLSSVCLRYGMAAIESTSVMPRTRERASVMFLCLLLVCGLGYFQIFSVNLGQVAAVMCTIAIACANGLTHGAVVGLLCGLSMALGGHDCRIALSLSLCGLCCAIPFISKRRWLCVPAALLGNLVSFFVTPLMSPPLSYWAVAAGGLGYALMPPRATECIRSFAIGVPQAASRVENTLIQQRIRSLQDAITHIAQALPQRTDLIPSNGVELGALLCAQCANRELCWGRSRARTERLLSMMMERSKKGESIDETELPILAEQGCLRADIIPNIAQDALILQKKRRAAHTKSQFERELTITHLAAMSGTLGELSELATGESLNDLQAAHQINLAISELRIPAKLSYARRVEGHLQVALQAESMLPIQKPLETLMRYLATEEQMPLSISRAERGRIELEEIPLYSAAIGTASLCAGQRAEKDDPNICGDSCVTKRCEGGRLLMMLSDGMGHGEEAHRQSAKTLELLLLLLEAGYTRRQAITAVNGIMLNAQEEEQYSTVDLADIDLWTGDVYSEKLGACASWIVRGNHMKKVEASSLPLGIMEEASPTAAQYRLHSGDILVMLSDGVADVFEDDEQMERMLEESLYIQPQRMADALLRNALLASDGTPKDDMSVMVMLLMDRQRGGE